MKRFLTAILCFSLSFAFLPAGSGAGFSRAAAEEADTARNVSAHSPAEDSLLLPSSYEQYLPLTAPSDVAVTKEYTAVADGSFIYLYSRKTETYSRYEHSANADEKQNNVAKLQFSETGTLYFLDASTYLYALNPETLAEERTKLVCSTFTIFSDVIYFTNVSSTISQISKTTLDNLDSAAAESVVGAITSKPAIAQDNGVLYYTDAGKYLHKVEPASFLQQLTKDETVVSLAVYSGILYYTDTAKNLYVRDLTTERQLAFFQGGYSALTVSDGYVYAVKNNAIRQYSPAEGTFTDYEICGSSDSENRLSAASEIVLTGDLLITADNGNRRASVYDTKADAYRAVALDSKASMLASDGETLLAADGEGAALYDLTDGERVRIFEGFNSRLVGIAAVYGKYYFITDNNYFYRAQKDGEKWSLTGTPKPSSSHTARLLTSDIYGSLYVAYTDGGVNRFTEGEFMDSLSAGENVCTVPVQAEKIAVDYGQTVYALYKNQLYVCASAQTTYPLSKTLVYGQTENSKVLSFAFGVESDAVYLLYDGDFIVETHEIPLPTVKTIPVNGADEDIFSEQSAVFSVVKTKENALMVRFDIASLSGAEVFPYQSFSREKESRTALRLGETGKYNLIAVFDEASRGYSTALVLKSDCAEVPESDYLLPATGFPENTGYLTNEIFLYKYPYLTELLTVRVLKKNTAVTVLGEIDTLDYRYYYVSYRDEEGGVHTGYIPQGYVANFNGAPPQAQVKEFGDGHTDSDSLWRMVFLLLGCACICVLVDYLILRQKKR